MIIIMEGTATPNFIMFHNGRIYVRISVTALDAV